MTASSLLSGAPQGTGEFAVRLEREAPAVPRLQVRGLCHASSWRTLLDDLGFDLHAGELLGVLGPRGSGKSELIACLTGLARPQKGTLALDGRRVELGSRELRAALGVVFQEPSLDLELTAEENLELGARLFGVKRAEASERAASLLEFMELTERADEPARELSVALRRRLEVARALIHRPSMLLLDEPTDGLEALARDRVWRLLRALNRTQQLTVLVATHDADEALRCDRLLVVDRGRAVASGTPAELLARMTGEVITLEAAAPDELAEVLRDATGLVAHGVEGRVVIEAPDAHAWVPRLIEALPPGTFAGLSLRRPSLSDVFYKLTGRTLEAANAERSA